MRQIRCLTTGRSTATLRPMPRTLRYAHGDTVPPRAPTGYVVSLVLLWVALLGYFGWNTYTAVTFTGWNRGPAPKYTGDIAEVVACLLLVPILLLPVLAIRSVGARCLPSTLLLAIGFALAVCATGITLLSKLLDLLSKHPPTLHEIAYTSARLGTLLFLCGSALVGNAYYAHRLERYRRASPKRSSQSPATSLS